VFSRPPATYRSCTPWQSPPGRRSSADPSKSKHPSRAAARHRPRSPSTLCAELPRAALLLVNGQVYLTWGSSCDVGPYHGWVMAYDARTLAQTAVFNTSPDAEESGIWQSDNGPAADDQGNIYAATGNGVFSAAANGRDYGDSLLKLGLANHSLNVLDYFTPFNEKSLNREDDDLGSGGPMLLPPQRGASSGLVLVGGKDGNLYVLDRGRMGKYQEASNSHAVQVIHFHGGIYAAPAFWNGHVYILASHDYLSAFALDRGKLSRNADAKGAFDNRERLRRSPPTEQPMESSGSSKPRPGMAPTNLLCSTLTMPPTLPGNSITPSKTALATA